MKRIGIIALLHESNTFLDRPTTIDDFRANLLCSGEAVLASFRGSQHEVGGFLDVLEHTSDTEAVGIFAARAMPYGVIETDCWCELMRQLKQSLDQVGKLDGLLVAPHGATVAEPEYDADGAWLTSVREIVGDPLPIIGTLDLHANVSDAMVRATNALFGYRTNPHLDQKRRGMDAAELLLRALRGQANPVQSWRSLPLCINIERQATAEPHGCRLRELVEDATSECSYPAAASCFYGFPYADVLEMGAGVLAVSEQSTTEAAELANRIANAWWEMRDAFRGILIDVEQAIRLTLDERNKHRVRPVGLLDMGDNVGGGSAADGTHLIHAWRSAGLGRLFAILYDPEVVEMATRVGVGNSLRCAVGGKLDSRHGRPYEGDFEVASIHDGRFCEDEIRHGGYTHFDQGPTVVMNDSHGITVAVTSRRMAPLSIQQILSLNLDPADYAAIVIKGVHAPVAAYAPFCGRLIRVNTPGSTCADLNQLVYTNRRRPLYPFEG